MVFVNVNTTGETNEPNERNIEKVLKFSSTKKNDRKI
jgi:hypothetical protein